MTSNEEPTHIFLIAVRDRQSQMTEFVRNTQPYLNRTIGQHTWEIWIIQDVNITTPRKPFNKGALFNIGFIELKARFPETWSDKILVLHDVDIYVKLETNDTPIKYMVNGPGIIRHPYGEIDPRKGPIMGCFTILYAADYAKVNGVPNYYGWGLEDVTFGYRCQAAGIKIDETDFIPRYSDYRIYDEISHQTPEDLAYIRACHERNRRLMQAENFKCPESGISTVKYDVVSSQAFNNSTFSPNSTDFFDSQIKIVNVQFIAK